MAEVNQERRAGIRELAGIGVSCGSRAHDETLGARVRARDESGVVQRGVGERYGGCLAEEEGGLSAGQEDGQGHADRRVISDRRVDLILRT